MHLLKTAFKGFLVFWALLLLGAGSAFGDSGSKSEPPPLWELGATAIGARLPHYIGSDEYENYLYPVPYIIYRGKILRADRSGVRGIFYKSEKFETNLSFWGNPPVSDENVARRGMPELDAVGEVGPALRYYLHRRGWQDELYLQLAIRPAWSFDFQGGLDIEMDYQGLHSSIDLSYQNKSKYEAQRLSLYAKVGIHFADSRYNDYFYGVATQYATAERRAYDADGGYAGFSISSSLYKELNDKFAVGCYARWNNISGAVFDESPLVREKNNYAVGALVLWKIAESKKPAR